MWFKVDDGFHASRKLLAVPKRARFAAAGLWAIAGSWCGDQLTDGHVPEYMLAEWGAPPSAPQALIDCGLWEREQGGYVFYKWHEYQPSKQDVDAERAASRARMRELRAMRKQKKPHDSADKDEAFGRTVPNSSESVRNPDPTRPDPTHLTEAKASGGDAAEPGQLFDLPEGAEVLEAEESATTNAGTIVAQWLESVTGPRPPGRVIGQLSKEIKNLLDEGHDYADVLAATQAWSRKATHPATLPSVLHEVRNPRTMTRGSEERLGAGLSLAQRAGRLNSQTNPFEKKAITP